MVHFFSDGATNRFGWWCVEKSRSDMLGHEYIWRAYDDTFMSKVVAEGYATTKSKAIGEAKRAIKRGGLR
jgi:hypothetical protein